MNVRIENGVTIISTGDAVGGLKNKTGHVGITYYEKQDRYRAELTYKYNKYLLGFYTNIDDAVAIRKEAERQKEKGNFMEWYNTLEKYQWHKQPRKKKES